jgi:hypothetical protein
MVRSLGLVLAVVAVLLAITFRPHGEEVRTVDWTGLLTQARTGAPYALVAPTGLPSAWRATSTYYDPPARTGVNGVTDWHVGFVTAADAYAGVEQTDGTATRMLTSVLNTPTDTGQKSQVGTATWQRWTNSGGDRRALVRTQDGVTVVVDGDAAWTELEQLAGSLLAQPPLHG